MKDCMDVDPHIQCLDSYNVQTKNKTKKIYIYITSKLKYPSFLLRLEGVPRLHFGPVASGRAVLRDESLRQAFALRCGAKAFDSEFDSVLESVIGNCRESFAVVRGVADYRDGTVRGEWGPWAALAAAAVTKSIVSAMNIS